MLVFAASGWHVLAGTFIFLAGLFTAFVQKKVFHVPVVHAVALYLWHSSLCIFYFSYSLNNTADSTLYYIGSLDYSRGFEFGTDSIHYIVSFCTQVLGLSYGNVFLLFNIVGYLGLIPLASALQTVTKNGSGQIKRLSMLFLYLPGLSFWSAAIGKDAVTFMGSGLAVWAVLDLSRRAPAFVLSVLLFLAPRPHMAGMLLLAFLIALVVSPRLSNQKRIVLIAFAAPISILGVQFGLSYAGLGVTDSPGEIADYFESRQSHNLEGGSSVNIADMSIVVRMFTYLFRPLLFDANGLLGMVVSFENLLLLTLLVSVFFRRGGNRSSLSNFERVFLVVFVSASWFVLANTTANLGIAIRQKLMFMPMLIVLAFAVGQGPPLRARTGLSSENR